MTNAGLLWLWLLILLTVPDFSQAQEAGNETSIDLQQQIEELRNELKRLNQEAVARRRLEVTEEEKEEASKEVLSAVGRQYTLLKKDTLEVEYKFSYVYYSFDTLRQQQEDQMKTVSVGHRNNHTLTNTLTFQYALLDNFTAEMGLPFVYKYDKAGSDDARQVTDFGSIFFGGQWQPMKIGGKWPSTILHGTFTTATGRSPFEIDSDKELSTGSGNYSLTGGLTVSGTIDPVVTFGSVSYTHNFDVTNLKQKVVGGRTLEKADLGNSVSLIMGLGYALSYKANLNLNVQYTLGFGNTYYFSDDTKTKTGSTTSALFTIGTGWPLSPQRSFSLALSLGLTNEDPDFILTFRVPFDFHVGKGKS